MVLHWLHKFCKKSWQRVCFKHPLEGDKVIWWYFFFYFHLFLAIIGDNVIHLHSLIHFQSNSLSKILWQWFLLAKSTLKRPKRILFLGQIFFSVSSELFSVQGSFILNEVNCRKSVVAPSLALSSCTQIFRCNLEGTWCPCFSTYGSFYCYFKYGDGGNTSNNKKEQIEIIAIWCLLLLSDITFSPSSSKLNTTIFK